MGIQVDVASLQGSVADITVQMVELKMVLSQVVRGAASTSRMRAVDGGGESRGGTHAAAGAGTRRARAPTGGGMGTRLLPDTEQTQDANSVGAESSNVSPAWDPHGTHAFRVLNGKSAIRIDEKFDGHEESWPLFRDVFLTQVSAAGLMNILRDPRDIWVHKATTEELVSQRVAPEEMSLYRLLWAGLVNSIKDKNV